MNNLHPVDVYLTRKEKEAYLKQKAKVIWLTGLSGSGKSTIAQGLEKALAEKHFFTQVLDGDNIRAGINNNLGFSETDRMENIRRIAEINKLFLNCGIITINAFISPTHNIRKIATDIIGKDNFIEIFIDAPLNICIQRDPKGLYQKAQSGLIKNFTGLDSPYQAPENPDLRIATNECSPKESIEKTVNFVVKEIEYTS